MKKIIYAMFILGLSILTITSMVDRVYNNEIKEVYEEDVIKVASESTTGDSNEGYIIF